MKKNGIVFGFLLVFLAGFVIGASCVFFIFPFVLQRRPPPEQTRYGLSQPQSSSAVQKRIMKRLESKLELGEEQKSQIEKEVKLFAEILEKFHESKREEMKNIFDNFIAKLSKQIPEEKVERLKKISGATQDPPELPQTPQQRRHGEKGGGEIDNDHP